MIDWRSSEGMTEVGTKRERISWESSGKERPAHLVFQSLGRAGMWVGM